MDEDIIAYLESRRTVPSAQLGEPGPDEKTLKRLLKIAARVPDHGKLSPWRFIVFDKSSRQAAVAWLQHRAAQENDPSEAARRTNKAQIFTNAPLVVGVVSAPLEHPKIPLWEQQLSSAAVCLNLVHAAHAFGFCAQWLTGWYAYDDDARIYLGLAASERIAGFIHIGTPTVPPAERDRPDVEAMTTHWSAPEDA
ncbi:MAG TPA: nitroreductase [Afifellaceae bacterium]|nr:nitroreductase [Afifellaceae bacterium]